MQLVKELDLYHKNISVYVNNAEVTAIILIS